MHTPPYCRVQYLSCFTRKKRLSRAVSPRGATKPRASIRVGFAILRLVALGVALQEVLMHMCARTPNYATVFGTYLKQALSITTWFSTSSLPSAREASVSARLMFSFSSHLWRDMCNASNSLDILPGAPSFSSLMPQGDNSRTQDAANNGNKRRKRD